MSIDKSNPFPATIKERFPLTKPGSSKETYHVALDLSHSGIEFKSGDSLGIFGQNDPMLVEHVLQAMKASGEEPILDTRSNQTFPIRHFLSFKANLSRLTSSFLKLLYEYETVHDKKNDLHRLLQTENKPLLSQYLQSHDPLDLLKEYAGVQAPLQELCAQFGPLLPRFYSVASSLKALPNEVHLTVALFTYTHAGEQRYGVASHFLNHLAHEGITPVPIYVLPAHNFRLPEDPHTPIIMVGPGTGVAPFRAFLQERIACNAPGKNWLFFGECHRKFDFFYEDFWTQLVQDGSLRLDLAFSRDQAEKVYVQHKMYENAADLWAWLQEGAYFYVCGDAHHMAKDVDAMLQRIAKEQGNLTDDAAKAYVKQLRTEKRYLLDVY
jgi:sulfite reductase (NADPH) flavoprotein alpha-component